MITAIITFAVGFLGLIMVGVGLWLWDPALSLIVVGGFLIFWSFLASIIPVLMARKKKGS